MNCYKQFILIIVAYIVFGASVVAAEEPQAEVRHGGVTTMLKNRDYELVATPTSLVVFVYQDEKPASTKDAKGTITVIRGEEKKTVELKPSGSNAMEAKGAFKVGAGAKAVGTITLSGRKPQEVSWMLK